MELAECGGLQNVDMVGENRCELRRSPHSLQAKGMK